MAERKYQSAKVAAEWWANQLLGPTKQDAGFKGKQDNFFQMLMMMGNERPLSEEEKQNIADFRDNLAKHISEELDRGHSVYLYVDYEPGDLLAYHARKAHITRNFPVKTHMTITKTSVEVSNGFTAPKEVLYEEKSLGSDGGKV